MGRRVRAIVIITNRSNAGFFEGPTNERRERGEFRVAIVLTPWGTTEDAESTEGDAHRLSSPQRGPAY